MKYILSFILLLTALSYSQPVTTIYRDIRILPGKENNELHHMFRIPFNRLVFEKNDNTFLASYEVMVEISDPSGNIINRNIKEITVTSLTYEETMSENMYSESLFTFPVPSGAVTVNTLLTDIKASRELRYPPLEINESSDTYLKPLVVHSAEYDCNGVPGYRLANYEGNLPFSEEPFSFLIPVVKDEISDDETIFVKLFSGDTTFWKGVVSSRREGSIKITHCRGIILSFEDDGGGLVNFILSGMSGLLPEGNFSVTVSEGESAPGRTYNMQTRWYNRPKSLADAENAIILLKYMGDEDSAKKLLKNKKSEYRNALTKYWKKSDPTPRTQFNPLMNEFYERIDYAARNFASVLKKDGIKSARGMVFIKYGKPLKVERSYNQNGKSIETWLYHTNKFIFVDEKGTGEFLLVEG